MRAWIRDPDDETRKARRELVIMIQRVSGNQYRVTDNRSKVFTDGPTEMEALLEYYSLATQAGVFDPHSEPGQ